MSYRAYCMRDPELNRDTRLLEACSSFGIRRELSRAGSGDGGVPIPAGPSPGCRADKTFLVETQHV